MMHYVLVIICFLIDEALIVLFPNSYLVNNLMFIPNLGFITMILTVRKFSLIDTCLFAFSCGMIYDFCFANTFLIYAVVFTMVACLMHLWTKHMTDTFIESLILSIVTIFVKDFLVYCYMLFEKQTYMSLMLWAERYELLTLLANSVLVMIIVVLIRIKDDYLEQKARKIRKAEKIEWFDLIQKED